MQEINDLEQKREQEEREAAEQAAEAQRIEEAARAERRHKFKTAANTVIASSALLAKIKSQAEKEGQKQKQMDFMIAKLKGKVLADKEALAGKLSPGAGGSKGGKSPAGSPSRQQRGGQPVGDGLLSGGLVATRVDDESSEDEFADQEEYAGPGISQDKLDEVLEKKFKALKIEFSDLVKNGIDASLLPLNKDINKLMQSFKTS